MYNFIMCSCLFGALYIVLFYNGGIYDTLFQHGSTSYVTNQDTHVHSSMFLAISLFLHLGLGDPMLKIHLKA